MVILDSGLLFSVQPCIKRQLTYCGSIPYGARYKHNVLL